MNSDDFVQAVKLAALDGAVVSTQQNLETPPGRNPTQELVQLSRWFHSLSAKDKEYLARTLRLVASHSVSTFLAILDGAKAIESGPEKGRLELRYVRPSGQVLLNDIRETPLNDRLGI